MKKPSKTIQPCTVTPIKHSPFGVKAMGTIRAHQIAEAPRSAKQPKPPYTPAR